LQYNADIKQPFLHLIMFPFCTWCYSSIRVCLDWEFRRGRERRVYFSFL